MTLFRKVNQSKWTCLLVFQQLKKRRKIHGNCMLALFWPFYLKKKIIAELDEMLTFS
jgi:hypothetical protein